MFKRITLFMLTNLLVIATMSIVINLLGIRPYLSDAGLDYGALMMFCLVWGMTGSFISLMMSRWMAKTMMGVRVIDPTRESEGAWLHQLVSQIAKSAGLPRTPEVGIYDNPEVNAFATGPSRSRALVAFSSGLLTNMNREQIEGVAAHEIAHIKNGDMVTMALLQGVLNAFVMFLARVIAFFVSQSVKEESRHIVNFLVVIILDILLTMLAMLIVAWFSRRREFRADAGAGALVGREKMISALRFLGGARHYPEAHASMAAFKISTKPRAGFAMLFATHPPIPQRISSLEGKSA